MSKLIFKLRNVPDDEAEAVRQILTDNNIDFFETDAGNWGVSLPALWLPNETDSDRAKNLIERYQNERSDKARQLYDEQKRAGTQRTMIDAVREKPLASLGLVLFCLFVLYFSIKPFVTLIQATH